MGEMETLRVDPEALAGHGRALVSAAEDIPPAPEPFVTTGQDAISQAIMGMQATIEGPILTGLPEIKTAATATGKKVEDAAQTYLRVDAEIAQTIESVLAGEAGHGATGAEPGAGAAPSVAAQSNTPVTQTAASASSSTGSGTGASGGDMSQLMSMPMQMAGQAAQIPSQAAGMLGALPGAAMQGAQQVAQQLAGAGGEDETKAQPDELAGADGPLEAGDRAPVEPGLDSTRASGSSNGVTL
jgi:hypothetical protein